jgi:hypothetical protein
MHASLVMGAIASVAGLALCVFFLWAPPVPFALLSAQHCMTLRRRAEHFREAAVGFRGR